jgi:hypothetical protein
MPRRRSLTVDTIRLTSPLSGLSYEKMSHLKEQNRRKEIKLVLMHFSSVRESVIFLVRRLIGATR